jgi:CheY-like chemotaxis protein
MANAGDIHAMDVLLVEDSAFQANLMRRILNVVGVREVVIVENGREALAQLKAAPTRFGVVICDLMMPEMTGYELVSAIRKCKAPGAEEVPIIIVTGVHGEEEKHRARLRDVQGFIRKPPTMQAVYDALKSIGAT